MQSNEQKTTDDDDASVICDNRTSYAELNDPSVLNAYRADLEALRPTENEVERLQNHRAVGQRGFQQFLRKKEIQIAISQETLQDLNAAENLRLMSRSNKRSRVQPTDDDYTLEEESTMNSVSLGGTSTNDDGSMTIMTQSSAASNNDNDDDDDDDDDDEEEEEEEEEDDDINSQYVPDDGSRTLLTALGDDDTINSTADDAALDADGVWLGK